MTPSIAAMPSDLPISRAAETGDDTAQLTVRLAQGEEAAWRELHGRYFERMHRYLLTVAHGHEEAAAEALQATFIKAVRHIHRLENEAQLWRWLALVARGALVDSARKRNRYSAVLARFSEERSTANPDTTGWEELLPDGLAQLPPEDRALLAARYDEGTSLGEIAIDAGTTPKAIESRLARIRARLKAWLTRAHNQTFRDEN